MFTLSPRCIAATDALRTMMLEPPQKAAPAIHSNSAPSGKAAKPGPLPPCAIRNNPKAATTTPVTCEAETDSLRNIAASASVKNACDCRTTDARPAGMPKCMA